MTARTFGPYPGTVVSVHDGDTCTIALDLGFGLTFTGATCRVYGINAPELVTQAGKDALAYAQTLLPSRQTG
jgi:endonuclease YncB( thermonuclease family)